MAALGLVSFSMFCPLPCSSGQVVLGGEHDPGSLVECFAALYGGLLILDDSIAPSNEESNEDGAVASLQV